MKRLIAILLALTALPCFGATIAEDFTGSNGALDGEWTVHQGAADLNTNAMRIQTGGFAEVEVTHSTSLSGVSQYIKASFSGTIAYPSFIARFTNASSPFYIFYLDGTNGAVDWSRYASVAGGGSVVATSAALGTFSNGDTLCITVDGTSTSTVIRFWRNCTGDAPSDASTWGGAAGASLTNDPASPVDTGSLVGVGASQSAANGVSLDNFFAGDIGGGSPATLSSPTPSGTLGSTTTATLGATTDQTTGTFYSVVEATGALLIGITNAQIEAGNNNLDAAADAACNASVSTTTPSCGASGLVANTAYSYSSSQTNANGDTNIVTGTFTTAAASAALLRRRRSN